MKIISNIIWSLFISIITYMVFLDLYNAFLNGMVRKLRITGFYLITDDFGMFIFTVLLKVAFIIVLFMYLLFLFKKIK